VGAAEPLPSHPAPKKEPVVVPCLHSPDKTQPPNKHLCPGISFTLNAITALIFAYPNLSLLARGEFALCNRHFLIAGQRVAQSDYRHIIKDIRLIKLVLSGEVRSICNLTDIHFNIVL
jgi:hypothetical protein